MKNKDLYKELETKRLLLKKITIEDAEKLYDRIYNDFDYCKFYYQVPFNNFEDYKKLVERYQEYYTLGNYFRWKILIKDTNETIGVIHLHHLDSLNNSAQIGCIIGYNYNKHGYAKEAVSKVINFAFEKINIHRINALIVDSNKKSINLAESVGMKLESIMEDGYKINDKYYNQRVYKLINNVR